MSKLNTKQLGILSVIASGERPCATWRQSLNALQRRGLITLTRFGYSITAAGLSELKQLREGADK